MNNILKISDAASLALHAVAYIGYKSENKLSTKEISNAFGFSEAHLSKVLQRLAKVGIVIPARGPKGGFSLRKSLNKITLLEVFEAIDGKITDESCILGTYVCESSNCIFGNLITNVNTIVKKYLQETSVNDVSYVCKNMKKYYNENGNQRSYL